MVGVVGVLVVIGAALGGGDSVATTPKEEQEFIGIVQAAQEASRGNEVAVHKAHEKRSAEMCELLPKDLSVTGWVGKVDSVDTTIGGDSGVLDLEIADGINVATWNNGFSDVGDGTLIDPQSDLYDTLAKLEEGDSVAFSGRFIADAESCLREQSLFETNSVEHPAFVFAFSAVEPG
ncbi:hypothetical protein [Nocardioides bigeumensis]|uniref:hypothetical protein n=1 Tax=Nocardioides bigeumensis TaxID=433657 RepID=UPI0031DC963E